MIEDEPWNESASGTQAFKATVVLQATRQDSTIAELARQHQVHPVKASQWKKQLLDGVEDLFAHGSSKRTPDPDKAPQDAPGARLFGVPP